MKLEFRPKAILFDLDGTLLHTLPQLSLAAIAVARDMGLEPPSVENMSHYVGNGLNMLLCRIILGRHDVRVEEVPEGQLNQARELFSRHYTRGLSTDFEVFEGVREGFEWFKAHGIKLGVVTNKPHVYAVPLLSYAGLTPYLGGILGGEVLKERKPAPEPLYHVLRELGVEPADALMVGDSISDVNAARAAGMPCVAFTYGYDGGFDLRTTCDPDYLFDSFGQLTELIKSLPERQA